MALTVDQPSAEVQAMQPEWAITEALMGGTAAMRKAGASQMEKRAAESDASLQSRIKSAVLFPAFRRTVGVMGGKPFSKPLTLGDDVPSDIKKLCENCDLDGRNLHSFASDLLLKSIAHGIAGVLVDYPKTSKQVRTLADERAIGARPYFVLIEPKQILGWKTAKVNGITKFTQLRLAEVGQLDDGEYGTKCVKRVRVLTPTDWELWEERDSGDYALIEGGPNTLGEVSFVPFYGWRTGFMTGKSPLMDVAYQNVQHWNDSSDQQKSVLFARVRMAVVIGADDITGPLTVSADSFMNLPAGSDIKVVQGSAESVRVGREELSALEEQMIQSGAELLVIKPGAQRTATQDNNEAEANKCDLQRIVETFEDSLDQALALMGRWIGIEQAGHVSMFKDFGAGSLSEASAQLIQSLQQGGLISKETAITELKRRGTLSAEVDYEDEQDKIGTEGPALGTMEPDPAEA